MNNFDKNTKLSEKSEKFLNNYPGNKESARKLLQSVGGIETMELFLKMTEEELLESIGRQLVEHTNTLDKIK